MDTGDWVCDISYYLIHARPGVDARVPCRGPNRPCAARIRMHLAICLPCNSSLPCGAPGGSLHARLRAIVLPATATLTFARIHLSAPHTPPSSMHRNPQHARTVQSPCSLPLRAVRARLDPSSYSYSTHPSSCYSAAQGREGERERERERGRPRELLASAASHMR